MTTATLLSEATNPAAAQFGEEFAELFQVDPTRVLTWTAPYFGGEDRYYFLAFVPERDGTWEMVVFAVPPAWRGDLSRSAHGMGGRGLPLEVLRRLEEIMPA